MESAKQLEGVRLASKGEIYKEQKKPDGQEAWPNRGGQRNRFAAITCWEMKSGLWWRIQTMLYAMDKLMAVAIDLHSRKKIRTIDIVLQSMYVSKNALET